MDEDTPDWLREFSASPAGDEEAPLGPVAGDDDQPELAELEAARSPDWLAEDQAELQSEELVVEQTGEEELAQAELPDWVREMRPIESVNLNAPTAPDADQRVEKAGPLAGLRGILPAEDSVARYHKPPVYSARLRISEKQRSQASLLDSILEQESNRS
jgi:hypothetical protein